MSSDRERLIFERAIARQWLSEEDLHLLNEERYQTDIISPLERWGPVLGQLVLDNRLTRKQLEELEREIDSGTEMCNSLGSSSSADRAFAFGSTPGAGGTRRWPAHMLSWERYLHLDHIGEGGMSRVYRAWDPKLERHVALKMLRGDDPDHVRRLLDEARAQAGLEHENVCKVYDVDEVDGQPYIAMQYVSGESIDVLRTALSREALVKALRDVCLAVHAAHRLGIIHRDIKPSNILLEQDGEGMWHPYILDFGLSRKANAIDLTQTGVIVGTPAYMSPEQAQGTKTIDRRSDVFSLGSTLYSLLVGGLPFKGCSGVDLLLKIVNDEPPPPRQRDPTIPRDLETIILHCLEKEPERRYDSAKALAEDLQRFLDDEPVLARRNGLGYRLYKTMRRHRAASVAVVIALIAVLTAASTTLRSKLVARAQAQAAQRIGQEINEIEHIMRLACLLPLHDLRKEKALVRQRMAQISDELAGRDELWRGLEAYALGCGHLALEEYEDARRRLEEAWQYGYRTPELEAALGRVLGALYQQGLEATRFEEPELRQARMEELRTAYRDPALRHLLAGTASQSNVSSYIKGLVALHEHRFPDALNEAERAIGETPWLFEARELMGDVYHRQAVKAQDAGEHEQALAMFSEAGEAYRDAMRIAPGYLKLYTAEASRLVEIIDLQSSRGTTPDDLIEQAHQICQRAMAIDPDHAMAYLARAEVGIAESRHYAMHGGDPARALRGAIADAQTALDLDSDNPRYVYLLARAQRSLGEHMLTNGQDPTSLLHAAAQHYDTALELDEKFANAYNGKALAIWNLAEYESEHGVDPRPRLEQAAAALDRALQLDPQLRLVYTNLGNVSLSLANYVRLHGGDPLPPLTRAEHSFRTVVELDPTNARGFNNLGNALQIQAELALEVGEAPQEFLEQAIASFEHSLAIDPHLLAPLNNLGITLWTKGRYEMEHGIDPLASFTASLEALDKILETLPQLLAGHFNRGLVLMERGRHRARIGHDPRADLQAAISSLETAHRLDPEDAETCAWLARAHLERASYLIDSGRAAGSPLAAADALLERAASIDPERCETIHFTGRLRLLQARAQPHAPAALALLERADDAFDRAIACDAAQGQVYLDLAASAYERCLRSGAADAHAACDRGIEACTHALRLNPSLAQAQMLRGALHLRASQLQPALSPGSGTARHSLARSACEDFEAGVAVNRFLQHSWEAQIATACQAVIPGVEPVKIARTAEEVNNHD